MSADERTCVKCGAPAENPVLPLCITCDLARLAKRETAAMILREAAEKARAAAGAIDLTDPANLGFVLPTRGEVVAIPPTTCCGIEWRSDAVRLGKQEDGRNVGFSRTGQCGKCEKDLTGREC